MGTFLGSGDILAVSPNFKWLSVWRWVLRLRLEVGYVFVRVRVGYSTVMVKVWVR